MDQQDQTLGFFKAHADDWQRRATDQVYSNVENRHRGVFEAMKAYPAGSALLDVGCGTGQLAIEASQLGWSATGIDFAQEMVDRSRANAAAANAPAAFECVSVFEHPLPDDSFDVISAQGFIEYISLEQLDQFLDLVRRALKPGGVLAVGSRNRLFNLHSLNAFTELEAALGTTDRLLKEACIVQSAKTQDEAIAGLAALGFEYEQPKTHPVTGIAVDTRYQFSPGDLITRLARHGLAARRIFPVHYHPLPLTFMADPEIKATHRQLAKHASDHWIGAHSLVPYSSSFVMEARKT